MKKERERVTCILLSFMLALMLAFQGTSPIFVMAKDAIENAPRDVDFSRPEALTAEEVGMDSLEVPLEENRDAVGQERAETLVLETQDEQPSVIVEAPAEDPASEAEPPVEETLEEMPEAELPVEETQEEVPEVEPSVERLVISSILPS